MKSLAGMIVAAILSLSTPALADDKADLAALLDAFLEAPEQGSFANHDRFWAEDLIYTSSAGERFGKQSIMDGIREEETAAEDGGTLEPDSTRYHADEVDIRLYGETAIVAFRLVAEGDPNGVLYYFNTGTFLKRDGEWQAVAWQATRIPAE